MARYQNRNNKGLPIIVMIIGVIVIAITYFAIKNSYFKKITDDKQTSMASPVQSSAFSSQPQVGSETKSSAVISSSKVSSSSKASSGNQSQASADGSWQLILVNGNFWLPENFTVDLTPVQGAYNVDKRIVTAAQHMLTAAKNEGVSLVVTSAYRSVATQTTLYNNKVKYYEGKGYTTADAQAVAGTIVAKPRTSEHHTGLAMDIITSTYTTLDDGFADTAAGKWLAANAYKYGFILRYPKDKQPITKIIFEPWHYRYVGLTAAKEIQEKNLCLEEYLGRT